MSKTSIEQSVLFLARTFSNSWAMCDLCSKFQWIWKFRSYSSLKKLMHIVQNWWDSQICFSKIWAVMQIDFFSLDFWGPSILKQYAYCNHKLEYDRNFHIHRNFQQKSHCLKNSKMCEQLEKVRSTDFLDKDLHFFEEIPGF